ncbi:MAG: SOS response-associated peptidase family protein [Burkholderiaceae bacterium]
MHQTRENSRMCNRYVTPDQATIERYWHVGRQNPPRLWGPQVHPRGMGPFIRACDQERELVVGQWALIPPFAKDLKLPYSTNNARAEELAQKPTYRQAWARGQRCIIPAESFDEPCWESGSNVWWRFQRADGAPWGLAGLWNTWVNRETGEVVESYTMLTLNADAHPLMSRMHKPDPSRPSHAQDKRSVIPIALADVDQWLNGSLDDAKMLFTLPPLAAFDAVPLDAPRQSSLI